MRRYQFLFVVILCFLFPVFSSAQTKPNPELQGTVSEGNRYNNSALGITLKLPGEWSFVDAINQSHIDPSCTGPLCGSPDINAALESKPQPNEHFRLYLSAWKLSPQYLNRKRYSLEWFANIMLEGSVGPNLVPLEKHKGLQLGGKPAFRLFMVKQGEQSPRVIGYVSEANGYVFLMVCATPTKPEIMESAIEAMELK